MLLEWARVCETHHNPALRVEVKRVVAGCTTVYLRDVQRILKAEVLWGEDLLDREVVAGFGCDLISDSLFFATPGTLLLTGLTHPQVVRAAELMEFCGVVFVRGKRPGDGVVDLAREREMPLLLTGYLMFDSCGLLYEAGLRGCRAGEPR